MKLSNKHHHSHIPTEGNKKSNSFLCDKLFSYVTSFNLKKKGGGRRAIFHEFLIIQMPQTASEAEAMTMNFHVTKRRRRK